MGRKHVVHSYAMFDDVDISTNQTSSTTNVEQLDQATIHISWTGSSPVGEIIVDARNGSADSWYQLDFGSSIAISGASGDHQILFKEMPFTDIRLRYVFTSGTGSLTARLTMKSVGA